jgi:bla regulator protein BlaR1
MPKAKWRNERRQNALLLLCALACLCAVGHSAAAAQTAQANPASQPHAPLPTYDVSVIKPHPSGDGGWSIGVRDNTFNAKNVTPRILIEQAYDIRPDLIYGLPQWADDAHYDLTAKTLDPDVKTLDKLTESQQQAMLAAVLVSRFQLHVHDETKEMPVYNLVVAQGGSKLKPTAWTDEKTVPKGADSGLPPGSMRTSSDALNAKLEATSITVPALADTLSSQLSRTVIDKTGVTGKYDIALKWMSDHATMSATTNSDEAAAPPLFKALEEQLGLKLEATKGPVRTVVVDHIERPSPN